MTQVRTLKPHHNAHGEKFEKKRNNVYDHPNPAADISAGFVKLVKENDIQGSRRGISGHGENPISLESNDGESDGEAGDENRPRADKGRGKEKSAG